MSAKKIYHTAVAKRAANLKSQNKYTKKLRDIDPDYQRKLHMFRRYGVSWDIFQKLLRQQKHKCKICRDPIAGKNLHIDHNHNSGKFRGILCGRCNLGLGALHDSIPRLKLAIKYLTQNEEAK